MELFILWHVDPSSGNARNTRGQKYRSSVFCGPRIGRCYGARSLLVLLGNVLTRCLPKGSSMSGSTIPAFRRCLVNRFLAMDAWLRLHYCGFQESCHIAPSLRLFVSNSPTEYHLSFFPKVSALDVFLWLVSFCCGGYSPTATTSLSALVPSGSLLRC
jgi:hypothetical protein